MFAHGLTQNIILRLYKVKLVLFRHELIQCEAYGDTDDNTLIAVLSPL